MELFIALNQLKCCYLPSHFVGIKQNAAVVIEKGAPIKGRVKSALAFLVYGCPSALKLSS
jgi:hypothetical protein